MSQNVNPAKAKELYELYAELHLICGRAASALRLSVNWDAPREEMLERFHKEEARAAEIWQLIKDLQDIS